MLRFAFDIEQWMTLTTTNGKEEKKNIETRNPLTADHWNQRIILLEQYINYKYTFVSERRRFVKVLKCTWLYSTPFVLTKCVYYVV